MTPPGLVTRLSPLALVGLLTMASCGGRATEETTAIPCDDDCGPGACEFDGRRYDDGTTNIPAGDGCNTCSCDSGQLHCSRLDCGGGGGGGSGGGGGGQSCLYDGVVHADGTSFPAGDGCNSCSCEDGNVACTLVACVDGCQQSFDCGPGDACIRPTGTCSGMGTCTPFPDSCPTIEDPVCGCDGATYGNSCQATASGVSVASVGPCPTSGCGVCGPGQYCALPEGQCSFGAGGATCVDTPNGCDDIYDPVCGCNGATYSNACEAATNGVNVLSAGACPVPCYGVGSCGTGEYCAEPLGQCFFDYSMSAAELPVPPPPDPGAGGSSGGATPPSPGGSNGLAPAPAPTGFCETRPTGCGEIYAPVCGCDNVTYGNACDAAAAGMSVLHEGACAFL